MFIFLHFPSIVTFVSLIIKSLNKNIMHFGAYNWLDISIGFCSLVATFLTIYFTGKSSREQIKQQHEENIRNSKYQNKMAELEKITEVIIELLRCFRADDVFRNVQLMVAASEYERAIVELDKLSSNIYLYRDKMYFLSDLKEIDDANLCKYNQFEYYDKFFKCKKNINDLINRTEKLNMNVLNTYRDYVYKLLNNYNCFKINEKILEQIDDLGNNHHRYDDYIVDAIIENCQDNIANNNKNVIDNEIIKKYREKIDKMLNNYNKDIPKLITNLTRELKEYLEIKESMVSKELEDIQIEK